MAPAPGGSIAWNVALGSALVLAGCIVNNVALELLIKEDLNPWADKSSGVLLTTLQFVFITATATPGMLSVKAWTAPTVPLWAYAGLACLSGSMSFLNNQAFAFNISQPTHMVFRTSGLLVSCLIGVAFFRRRYSAGQVLAVLGVAVGASLCTVAEAMLGDTAAAAAAEGSGPACCGPQLGAVFAAVGEGDGAAAAAAVSALRSAVADNAFAATWLAGIALLCVTVTLGAVLGQLQKMTADVWGKAPQEAIFFLHLLPLPLVLGALGGQLSTRLQSWNASPPLAVALPALSWGGGEVALAPLWAALPAAVTATPVMWVYAGVNVLSQWVCIQGVFRLTAWADPLTATLVLTVRKFLSLLLSVTLFGNTFTPYHWLAAALVFTSAAGYAAAGAAGAHPPAAKQKVQ